METNVTVVNNVKDDNDNNSAVSESFCDVVLTDFSLFFFFLLDQKEEVDQFLDNTRIEMYATVQPGGNSPKPMNSSTPSQLNASLESVMNGEFSFGSQDKGKKRDNGDLISEPVKRERLEKIDDSEPAHHRLENSLISEIGKITDTGGLDDFEGVEKLVQLMVTERSNKKIDLEHRSTVASVIASTDNFDCLSQFVRLKGLQEFDKWLQEFHKRKYDDDAKPVEEFVLVLLGALDKLPIDLQALQMCHIGRSVNRLRGHKNIEIERKTRSLVDRWKKGVEAELNEMFKVQPTKHEVKPLKLPR